MKDDTAAPRFILRTLGSFGLSVQADPARPPVPVVLGEKSCALLAYLWIAERRVPREDLCALLWDGVGSSSARNNLRQALFRIRRVLGAQSIQEEAEGLWLTIPGLVVDVAPLLEAASRGERVAAEPVGAFAAMRQPVGRRFIEWRDAVRRRIGRDDTSVSGAGAVTRGRPMQMEPHEAPRHPLGNAQILESLANAWQLSMRGVAMSAWVAATTGPRRHDAVQAVRQVLREQGASVALVGVPPRKARGVGSLWAAVAAALWSKPGAMGVAPEHVRLLEDVPGAISVDAVAARRAVLDLLRAVSEERPLAIVVEDAVAYGSGTAEGFVRAIASLRGTPVLVVLLAPPLAGPVSPICLTLNGFGDTPSASMGAALRASRQSAG